MEDGLPGSVSPLFVASVVVAEVVVLRVVCHGVPQFAGLADEQPWRSDNQQCRGVEESPRKLTLALLKRFTTEIRAPLFIAHKFVQAHLAAILKVGASGFRNESLINRRESQEGE